MSQGPGNSQSSRFPYKLKLGIITERFFLSCHRSHFDRNEAWPGLCPDTKGLRLSVTDLLHPEQ